MAITATEARENLFPLIEQVNEDRTPVEMTSRRGDAVLISRADYDSLEATAHLLRAPANSRRLLESLQQALSGRRDRREPSLRLVFTPHGWEDYTFWTETERAMLRRVNRLIEAALRDPSSGIGKPEPLRHLLSGAWSRRISDEHRLVYLLDGEDLVILQSALPL